MAAVLLAPGGLTAGDSDLARWLEALGGDKLIHLVLFFGQAFWLSRALAGQANARHAAWRAAAVAALYGLLLEVAQLAVPGRGFETADLVANTVGACLWPLLARLLRRR